MLFIWLDLHLFDITLYHFIEVNFWINPVYLLSGQFDHALHVQNHQSRKIWAVVTVVIARLAEAEASRALAAVTKDYRNR